MPKFDVLDPLHPVVQPHFLEASAGTGKTFSIEHLVARLFLDTNINLEPSSILIVTFTRASTRDLKVRIRQNILDIFHILKEKKSTPFRYLQPLLEEDQKRLLAAKRLENVLATFDEMEIFTIHGFCRKMLQEYPFEATIGLSQENAVSTSLSSLHHEIILDVLRVCLDEKKFHVKQLQKLLSMVKLDLDQLVLKISKLASSEIAIEPPLSYAKLLEKLDTFIETSAQYYEKVSFEDEYLQVASHFKGLANTKKELHPHFLEQAKFFAQRFENKISSEQLFDKLLKEKSYFFEYLNVSQLKKNAKMSFEELHKQTQILSVSEVLMQLFEHALNTHGILLHVAYLCQEALQRITQEQGLVSPDYFLTMMQQKLLNPAFLDKVQKRYQAALIDEFQDTDPVQWSIFEKIFVENRQGFPLVLVGDPKQSIYGFRNADLPTYLRAKNSFLENQRFTLDTNYRSEPQLIEALNTLFSLNPGWLCHQGSLVYENVKSSAFAKNTPWTDGKKALHFFMAETEETRYFSSALKAAEEDVFFPCIAQEIHNLIEQGFAYEDMAILVRDRYQGDRLERFLKQQKIPYMATARVALRDCKSFSFFKLLLQILGSNQPGLCKQLFAHPLMGFSHHALKQATPGSAYIFGLEALKKLIRVYESSGFLTFWQDFLQTRFTPSGQSFEKELLSKGLSQEYFDLVQLGDLLVEKQHQTALSHQELWMLFQQIENADPDEDPLVCRRASCDSSAVVVMTIHKSKGLEFKVVFSLGTCACSVDRSEIVKSKQESRQTLQVFDDNNPEHHKALEQEQMEKMRHLYVAFTRAKQRLYVPYLFFENPQAAGLSALDMFFRKSFSEQGVFNKNSCLDKLKTLCPQHISYSFEKPCALVCKKEEKEIEIKKPCKFPKNFKEIVAHSYSSMSVKEGFKSQSKAPGPLEGQMPSSAEVGEIFHKILEKVFERGLHLHKTFEALEALVKQETAYSCLKEFNDQVIGILKKLLTSSFSCHGSIFCFKDLPLSCVTTEMEFLLQEKDRLYTGVIDLFFKWQGKYFLVDWKSNYLGPDADSYELCQLEKCMQENNYHTQASLYIQAAKAFLEKKEGHADSFGGMMYIFLRGLEHKSQGVYLCQSML